MFISPFPLRKLLLYWKLKEIELFYLKKETPDIGKLVFYALKEIKNEEDLDNELKKMIEKETKEVFSIH